MAHDRVSPPGRGANANRVIKLIRKGVSAASQDRYGVGGRLKERRAPRPITLPKLKLPPMPEE